MSCCPKCGSPVSANDRFCSKCGAPVNTAPSLSSVSEDKTKTSFSIGALTGIGASLLLIGLFVAFALNGIYNRQTSYLAQSNIQVNIYGFGFDDMVFLIGFGALLAIFGAYALTLGCLGQLSIKARTAIGLKDSYARIGNGFLTGGILMTGLLSANFIRNLYRSTSSSWYELVLIVFIVGGLIALAIGAFLIRYSYQRSLQRTQRNHSYCHTNSLYLKSDNQ